MTTIPLSSITETDPNGNSRARQDYGDLSSLTDSIKKVGLIQPIVLTRRLDNSYILAAGGRRKRCLEQIGFSEVTEGITCDPARPGFVFADNIPEDVRLEIELDENMERLGMKWSEEVLLIARTHYAKKKRAAQDFESWGMRQTGNLLNVSYGKVQYALQIAELLQQGDPAILKATSLSEAMQTIMSRNEDQVAKLLAGKSGIAIVDFEELGKSIPLQKRTASGPGLSIDLTELSDDGSPQTAQASRSKIDQDMQAPGFSGDLEIPLSQMFILGDSVRDVLPKMRNGIFDHIITDIPYGINMENLDLNDQERVDAAHEIDENVELMPMFLEQSFRTLKDQGFCIFWYDQDHHEKLQNWAREIGFKVQRWAHMWIKLHNTRNQAAQYNETKKTETAMFLRKGNATMVKQGLPNYIMADGSIERKLYKNPFAKPFEVWKDLIDRVAIQGQVICDPFGGEFSFARAAINCGMRPISIEKYEHHYNNGLEGIKTLYNTMTQNKAVFV